MEDLKISGYKDALESKTEELKEKIMEAVERMHSQGWVHGDMRLKNIMFKQDNNNEWKVKLINFDWADKEGYASYPLIINRKLPMSSLVVKFFKSMIHTYLQNLLQGDVKKFNNIAIEIKECYIII